MPLDPATTASALVVASGAMSAGLFASARRQPEPIGEALRLWSLALLCAPTGWLMLVLSLEPGRTALAIPGKVMMMAAFVGYLHALLVLNGGSLRRLWRRLPVAAVALASTAVFLLQPNQPMRTGLLTLLCAVGAGTCAYMIWPRADRRLNLAQPYSVAVAFAFSAMLLGLRGVLLYLPEGDQWRVWVESAGGNSLLLGLAMLAPAVSTVGVMLISSEQLLDRLQSLASIDPLTGTATRAAFLKRAGAAVARMRQLANPCALLAIDVDHFKSVNDRWGHAAGDHALALIGDALRSGLRAGDFIGRCGGEEFMVLLPDTDITRARALAERLRQRIAELVLVVAGDDVPLRVSVGVASLQRDDASLMPLYLRADQALYHAKREGRDRVRVWAATTAIPTIAVPVMD